MYFSNKLYLSVYLVDEMLICLLLLLFTILKNTLTQTRKFAKFVFFWNMFEIKCVVKSTIKGKLQKIGKRKYIL